MNEKQIELIKKIMKPYANFKYISLERGILEYHARGWISKQDLLSVLLVSEMADVKLRIYTLGEKTGLIFL